MVASVDAAIPTVTKSAGRSVLVVDDHRTFAELLAGALSGAGMRVVGVAHSGAQAVTMAQQLQPEVVVIDIRMPQQDGLAATRRIRDVAPDTVVAVVTAHRNPEWLVRSAQAGAAAFIVKNGSLAEMLDVLGRARAGQMLVAPSAFAGRPEVPAIPTPRRELCPDLTPRERQVLDCLSQGMAVKAIARVLGVTELTCRGYVKALHTKLGARSQLEAVVRAQKLGLLAQPYVG
jgi:DNA-binding NarL/FixJ family response regulator